MAEKKNARWPGLACGQEERKIVTTNQNTIPALDSKENLTDIKQTLPNPNFPPLDAQVSVFHNALATNPSRSTTMKELLAEIKGDQYKAQIGALRGLIADGKENEYTESKKRLVAFSMSALLKTRAKDVLLPDRLISHSNLLQIDIDKIPDVENLRQKIQSDPHTLFCFLTPSGRGLKVGVRIDGTKHLDSFLSAQSYFKEKYDVAIDPSVKDVVRLCFVSHDPDLFINEAAEILPVSTNGTKPEHPVQYYAPSDPGRKLAFGGQALDTASKMIEQSTEGQKLNVLLKASELLGGYIAGGMLTEDNAKAHLRSAIARKPNVQNLDAAFKAIDDGLLHGQQKPIGFDELIAAEKIVDTSENWEVAKKVFPRIPFPWKILPDELSTSLHQLARACATSEKPLPGTCFTLFSAVLGRLYSVCPKPGWKEPLIMWHGDIRDSGDGKTPASRILCETIEERQRKEHARYDAEEAHFLGLPKQDQLTADPPAKVRGFFLTGMTLEGLRDDLEKHPTGGLLVIQDELSAFVSGQNQYKGGKGDDRESWLKLFDGNDARIGRSKRTIFITGARPSLVGGIQPAVFRKAFTSEDGVFLSDGTIFRFLMTYDRSKHYPLTRETWSDDNRRIWESILIRALDWTDRNEKNLDAIFDTESQELFCEWRNEIDSQKSLLHPILKGFIPKAVTYTARLTGIIHCIHAFSRHEEPDRILTRLDLERGIQAVRFYMGQIVDAMQLIENENHKPTDERSLVLAQVLDGLRGETDSGRLAVGFIMDQFNLAARGGSSFDTPHAFGAFLRECGLAIANGKYNANGRMKSKCLLWDSKTNLFIEQSLNCLHSLQNKESCGFDAGDIEKTMSPNVSLNDDGSENRETMETLKNQCLPLQPGSTQGRVDNRDKGDIVSNKKIKCGDCSLLTGSFCRCKEGTWNGQRGQDPEQLHSCDWFSRREVAA
ncbi:MAG: DUF3987 domain-containing protein [Syntrophobacteraceae bacterium]